jgi:hypothetical protein
MNILFKIIVIIASLIILMLILAFFTKKDYSVQREIIINRSKIDVFNYVKYLKNQDHFSKWVMIDPNMKKDFVGSDGSVGFIYKWDGNKQAGKGEQEITGIKEGERVDMEIRFEKPFSALGYANFSIFPLAEDETKLIWQMKSEMNYPMNLVLLFMNMDKVLGADMDESLQNLKSILESN